ncbi:MAG: hypothetical protein KKB05_01420, partial [Proteobacteria bacterium]|nr:hypothetical protein [Pseudomonadota bacterium]
RKFTVGIAGTGKNAKVLGTLEVLLLDGAEKIVKNLWNIILVFRKTTTQSRKLKIWHLKYGGF